MLNTVFVSYSRKNQKWLERFEDALKPGVIRNKYNIWSDKQLRASEEWRPEIEAMMSAAKVALLLVTPEFLASSYIATKELPELLARRSKRGLQLFWVPVESVSEEMLHFADLDKIQACWEKDRPLASLPDAD